jgi:hypothetical protein
MSIHYFPGVHKRNSSTRASGNVVGLVILAFIVVAALVAADLYASKGTYSSASMATLGRMVWYTFL